MDFALATELLSYNSETGILTWKWRDLHHFKDTPRKKAEWTQRCWNSKFANKPTGPSLTDGYKYVRMVRGSYRAHRLCWLLATGEWATQIDHINGDRADNRLINLRNVSRAENMRNKKLYSSNTSGVIGVCRDGRRWRATIRAGGPKKFLGLFDTIEEAAAARKKAEEKLGVFHPNHGRSMATS